MKKTFKHKELDGIGECSLYDKEIVVAVDDVNPQPVFCEECGRELVEVPDSDTHTQKPHPKRVWLWLLITAIVGMIIIFMLIRGCNPTNQYTITVKSDNDEMGLVKGGGAYDDGDTVVLSANAKEGFCFINWSDSLGNIVSRDSVWRFCVKSDTMFIAHFVNKEAPVQQYTISVNSFDMDMGYVSGGGTYPDGTTITIKAVANDGYVFSHWLDGNGQRVSTTANYRVYVVDNMDYTAHFKINDFPDPLQSPVYGKYSGPRNDNNEPHGKGGRVTITTEYHWGMRVFSPGDVIENTIYENGQLKHGRVVKKDGESYNI